MHQDLHQDTIAFMKDCIIKVNVKGFFCSDVLMFNLLSFYFEFMMQHMKAVTMILLKNICQNSNDLPLLIIGNINPCCKIQFQTGGINPTKEEGNREQLLPC